MGIDRLLLACFFVYNCLLIQESLLSVLSSSVELRLVLVIGLSVIRGITGNAVQEVLLVDIRLEEIMGAGVVGVEIIIGVLDGLPP